MLKTSFLLNEVAPQDVSEDEKPSLDQDSRLETLIYHIWMKPVKHPKSMTKAQQNAVLAPPTKKLQYTRRLVANGSLESIRLLRILPGGLQDDIRCELEYVLLDNHPLYQALSYCWGDEKPSVNIECDGLPFTITPNLASALRAFRRVDSTVWIWADAICIDQSSVPEKNYQVPLMRRIYQESTGVLIWLGNDTPDGICRRGMRLVQTIARLAKDRGGTVDLLRLARQGKLEQHGLPHISRKEWRTVRDMVERPWFGRTWIVQEIAVSPTATLYCDDASMSWDDFQTGFLIFATRLLPYRLDALPSLLAYAQVVQLISTSALVGSHRGHADLLTILSNHMVAQATDPRDKLYGLLGLFEMVTGKESAIKPDYHQDLVTVFTQAATDIIRNSQDLDILSVPKRLARSGRTQELPSWAPNWSDSGLSTSLSFKSLAGVTALGFDAAQTATAPRLARLEGNSLVVSGYSIEKIAEVGIAMDPYPNDELANFRVHPPSTITKVVSAWWNWDEVVQLRSDRAYPSGGNIYEAYARTLVLDQFNSGFTTHDIQHFLKTRRALLGPWSLIRAVGPRTIAAVEWLENRITFAMGVRIRGNKAGVRYSTEAIFGDMFTSMYSRKIFRTEGGYIGVASPLAMEGDCVCLVKGSRVPLVLRPREGNRWELMGDCYMHGIMHGQAFEEELCRELVIV